MKNKILGLIVCMLLLASAVFPVIGIANTLNLTNSKMDSVLEYTMAKRSKPGERETTDVWTNMSPSFSGGILGVREMVSMTYDSTNDRTILFGGANGGYYNDTWAYNYNTNMWVNRSPSYSGGTLSFRSGGLSLGLAYDSDADRSILFGGYDGGITFYNETWAYDYSTNMWVNRSPSVSGGSLTPRTAVVMAYYDSADRMIMFGGYDNPFNELNETWEYNYTDNMWVNRDPTVVGSLPECYGGDMVYDSNADLIILLGGGDVSGDYRNETWVYCYDNNTWWERNPGFVGGTLTKRAIHGMVYDSGADRTILFGGMTEASTQLNDTWVYNYTDNIWYKVDFNEVGGSIYPREAFGMVYDSGSDRTVVACGFYQNFPGNEMNDTWAFLYNYEDQPPNTPTQPSGPTLLLVDESGPYITSATDPDNDLVQYRFDWDANGSHDYSIWTDFVPSGVESGLLNSWDTGGTYIVKAQAKDLYGLTSEWSNGLSVYINGPPNTPSNPNPENGSTDVDINATLSWDCSDPDGDDLTYDVYFEANDPTPDELVSNNQSENQYDPGTMEYNTHYYWKIVAWDPYQYTEGPVWDFTTGSDPNNPPYIPSDPDPENDSTNVDIEADLSWTGGDPDENDTVVYDVYLEANDPTPDIKVADDITETTFDPGTLDYETVYYWRIIAKDNHGASTWGPVWHFTTEEAIPDLNCGGSLSWADVPTGSTVTGYFYVENIGDPTSLLDWEIESYPEWGTWTITPEEGYDLTPELEPFVVEVSVEAPDKKNSEFTGEVKIVNSENSSDYCTVDVSLATPKNKAFNFNFPLLSWLFERFPNAFPILRYMLGL